MKPKKSRPQLPRPYLIPADFRLPDPLLNQAMLRVAILLNRGICNEFYWVCQTINVEGKVDVSFDATQLAILRHEEAGRVRLVKRTRTESKFCEQAESYYGEETDFYYVVAKDSLFKWWEEQEGGEPSTDTKKRSIPNAKKQSVASDHPLLKETDKSVMELAKNKALAVEEKMQRIIAITNDALTWKSPKWSELLGVSDSRIRQTEVWKTLQTKRKSPD